MGFFSNVHAFAPTKRITALIIVVVAVVSAALIARHNPAKSAENTGTAEPVLVARPTVNETDSDNDGVPDWKEELWGLNPYNPDSDGDGINDAQEIENEQQLKEETKQELLARTDFAAFIGEGGLSKTDVLARTLLEEVVAFKSAGISLDQTTSASIADKLVGALSTGTQINPPTVSSSQLTIVAESPATLRAYGNALGSVLGGAPTTETNELLILAELGQTGDYSTLEKLAEVKASYRQMVAQLTNIPVPAPLAQTHLAFINSMLATSETFDLLAKIESDPFEAIMGIQTYVTYSKNLTASFSAISGYLRTRVVFSESEAGYTIVTEQTSSR